MQQLQAALANYGQSSTAVTTLLQLIAQSVDPLDVHIASPGGVGSTELSNFLTAHDFNTNLLVDNDGLRHSPSPPEWCCHDDPCKPHPQKPRHVVYMYGNPYSVVCSHYRRGHAWHQAQKTCGNSLLPGPQEAFPRTPEEYFERGQDLFGLKNHYEAWFQGARAYKIILLRYEAMFDTAVAEQLFGELCSHKSMSKDDIALLVTEWLSKQKPRSSKVPEIANQTGLYEDLDRLMQDLPGIKILDPCQ